jgi:hypothetical protein
MGLIAANRAEKTNFSANGQTLELDVSTSNAARIELSGVYAFTATFETSSDGVNWFLALGTMINAVTTATAHSTANAAQAYTVNCVGASKVRVRLTAFTSAGAHRVAISAN